jgi:hypothetical protein
MALYSYETQLVISADAVGIVVQDAYITIYNIADTDLTTPLALVDARGLPLPNPVPASQQGFIPAFQATTPQVLWYGGGYVGYINSFQGVLTEAQNAAASAATAAAAAQVAASGGLGSVGYANLPAGTTITVVYGPTTYPLRPTTRTDLQVRWRGPVPPSTGAGGAITGVDAWENTTP